MILIPDADNLIISTLNESNQNTNLYLSINEDPVNDSTFIKQGVNGATYEATLSNPPRKFILGTGPIVCNVRYNCNIVIGSEIFEIRDMNDNIFGSLTLSTLTTGIGVWVTSTFTVTGISDYDNLKFHCRASSFSSSFINISNVSLVVPELKMPTSPNGRLLSFGNNILGT